ncbi:putative membrane protein [Psilocybe cubensis]|uniref:MFS general substrate transporter n=2 Tax=Psilocybe cubensis TaxID=181762 RepID=A0A8H7Y3M5_PSICU|nr:putative membrane protein [Psilocybe cubensis]KAH9484438.1 putative membrane protein [Psilocybe cubensis]
MPTQSDVAGSPQRPQQSRTVTSTSQPYVPQPESLILPDGAIGEEAAELLGEFVHPHHIPEETLVGSDDPMEDGSDDELDKRSRLPWWKRPSPWWLLGVLPFTAIAMSATIAPRIEIYTILACSVHKPDIFRQAYPERWAPNNSTFPSVISESPYQPNDIHAYDAHPALPLVNPVYHPASPNSDVIHWSNNSDGTPNRNLCASDPTVLAAVAKLTAVITATMGILSLLTTGWWGAFSDRHGRTRVMGISILALLITDFNFILVAKFYQHLPGGYWFLVVGPALEGLFGGMATGIAAMHGYMADTTAENTRSRMFSLSLGLLFSGMAIGPTLGSLLIRFTGETLSVFYLATAVHLAYTVMVWTVLPEPLTKEQMQNAKDRYNAELSNAASGREQLRPSTRLLVEFSRIFTFLVPLAIFLPKYGGATTNPLKTPGKDYNLALMAIAYGFTISVMGSYTYKFQYAASTFGWSTETIGYWVSLSGATRAIFMAIILPLLIKIFKPKPITLILPATPSEATPLLDSRSGSRSSSTIRRPGIIKKEIHSPAFDLGLARGSLLIEIVAYFAMGITTAPIPFLVLSIFGSLGSGFSPATQSVMLSLYSRRGGTEFGRLFGALSVIQALCSQVIGPTLYGFVFIKTVTFFPAAIFYLTTFSVTISFILLALVRVPKESEYRRESIADLEEPTINPQPQVHHHEETLVDTRT